jgi:hypothetical protein
MKKQIVCFIAICFAVAGGYFAWRHQNHPDLEKLFGGPENQEVVRSPGKVLIWKTAGFLNVHDGLDGQPDMKAYYRKGGEPLVVPDSLAKSFSELLSKSSSYYYDTTSSKSCAPMPGFVLGFMHGKREVDVFLCFECDILMVQVEENYKEADFDPSHNNLLQLVKALYPGDQKVQAIRERNR